MKNDFGELKVSVQTHRNDWDDSLEVKINKGKVGRYFKEQSVIIDDYVKAKECRI